MEISTLVSLLVLHGIPQEDIKPLVCIAYEESKFDHKAVNHYNRNGTKDYGYFQINSIWFKECNLSATSALDKDKNIKCAVHVYNKQGLTAWSTYKKCKGKKYEISYNK